MKLLSPNHRGTRCQCRCPGTPAPAARPRFSPTLNPSGFIRFSKTPVSIRSVRWVSSSSSSVSSSRRALCALGVTSRCPLLYGYRFSTTTDSSVRWTTRFARSSAPAAARQMKQSSPAAGLSFGAVMYASRHGAHSLSTSDLIVSVGKVSRPD